MTYSVPASLLLAGEYALTRPGGEGIALAVAPRARASFQDDGGPREIAAFRRDILRGTPPLRVRALQGSAGTALWPQDHLPVVQCVLTALMELLPREGQATAPVRDDCPVRDDSPPRTVTVDTSCFFSARGGVKQGLGSSAAATVLLVAALLHLIGLNPLKEIPLLFRIAHRAHRVLQGGRGSGYDLACSITGGTIRFRGGDPPGWTSLDLHTRWEAGGISLFSSASGSPVKSGPAVEAFARAFPRGSVEAERFLERNNTIVGSLGRAESRETLFSALAEARELSQQLGERIGVPAVAPLAGADDLWRAKTSGAGDEQIILFVAAASGGDASPGGPRREALPGACPREMVPLTVEPRGLIREEVSCER